MHLKLMMKLMIYCLTAWLSVRVIDVDVIRAVCVVAHYNTVSTSVFVGSLYGVGVPVSPVQQILKQGQSVSMRQGTCYNPMSVLSIHISITVGKQTLEK